MPKPQNDDKIATNSRADNGAKGEVGCDLDSDHKKTTKKATITMKSMGSPHLDTHNVIQHCLTVVWAEASSISKAVTVCWKVQYFFLSKTWRQHNPSNDKGQKIHDIHRLSLVQRRNVQFCPYTTRALTDKDTAVTVDVWQDDSGHNVCKLLGAKKKGALGDLNVKAFISNNFKCSNYYNHNLTK